MSPRLTLALGLLLALGTSAGCASSTRIQVISRASTNGGQPLHMLMRSGDQVELGETYDAAAKRAFTREEDKKRLERQVIIPGVTYSVSLDVPEGEDLGVYFFFTGFEESEKKAYGFRLLFTRTELPAEIFVELGDDEILDFVRRRR